MQLIYFFIFQFNCRFILFDKLQNEFLRFRLLLFVRKIRNENGIKSEDELSLSSGALGVDVDDLIMFLTIYAQLRAMTLNVNEELMLQ